MRANLKDGVLTVIADSEEESLDLLMWHGEYSLEPKTVALAIVEYRNVEAASGVCEIE